MTDSAQLLKKHSFVELGARQRARALLDAGSFRELIDPLRASGLPLAGQARCGATSRRWGGHRQRHG